MLKRLCELVERDLEERAINKGVHIIPRFCSECGKEVSIDDEGVAISNGGLMCHACYESFCRTYRKHLAIQ